MGLLVARFHNPGRFSESLWTLKKNKNKNKERKRKGVWALAPEIEFKRSAVKRRDILKAPQVDSEV